MADDAHLALAWNDRVACTSEHFARQNLWMRSTAFPAKKVHTVQHLVVLEVMREGLVQAREGRLLQVREMARQLRSWYVKHAQTMDAALAHHLRGMRFDPMTVEDVSSAESAGPAGVQAPMADRAAITA